MQLSCRERRFSLLLQEERRMRTVKLCVCVLQPSVMSFCRIFLLHVDKQCVSITKRGGFSHTQHFIMANARENAIFTSFSPAKLHSGGKTRA